MKEMEFEKLERMDYVSTKENTLRYFGRVKEAEKKKDIRRL